MASLLKIVSTGMQDERLQPPKGQPNLDSFLMVIVKAGRYATNWSRIDFDTKPDFGSKAIIRLPTKGEMIGRVYLVTVMPDIRSQQQVAYYTRKPIRVANSNYRSVNMFENGTYANSATIIYQPTAQPYGLANFTGVQLDDLIVGGVYSLTYTVPAGYFALLITTRALNTPQFNILNSDTLTLFTELTRITSSYNGNIFNSGPLFPLGSVAQGASIISYNGSIYLAGGEFTRSSKNIILYNNLSQPINMQSTGRVNSIAFNGNIYVAVGEFAGEDNSEGAASIIYSTDGINWSTPFHPLESNYGFGYSVAWIAARQIWMAVGLWSMVTQGTYESVTPVGIKCTSTDGINWSTPSFIPSPLKVSGQEAGNSVEDLIRPFDGGPNMPLGVLPTWLDAETRSMPNASYSGFLNNITNIDTFMHSEEESDILAIATSISSVNMIELASNITTLRAFNGGAISKVNFIKTQFEDMLNALTVPVNAQQMLSTAIQSTQAYYTLLLPLINTSVLNFFINDLSNKVYFLQYSSAISDYIAILNEFIAPYVSDLNFIMGQFNFLQSYLTTSLDLALVKDPQGEILTAMGAQSWTQPFPIYSDAKLLSSIWTIEFEDAHLFQNGDQVTLSGFTTYNDQGETPIGEGSITSTTSNKITISVAGDFSITGPFTSADVVFIKSLFGVILTSCVPDTITDRWILSSDSLPDRLIVGDTVDLIGFLEQPEFIGSFEVKAIGTGTISIDVTVPSVPPTVTPGSLGKAATELAVSGLNNENWTITFAEAHPFTYDLLTGGDSVTLSGFPVGFDGTYSVTATTTYTITVTGDSVAAGPYVLGLTPVVSIPVTSLALSTAPLSLDTNGVWTVTYSGIITRTFAIGNSIVLSGFSPLAINGTWTISSVDSLMLNIVVTGTTIANVPPTIDTLGFLGASIYRSKVPISAKIPNSSTWKFFLGIDPHKFSITPQDTVLNQIVIADFDAGFNGQHTLTAAGTTTITITTTDSLSYPTTIGTITLKNGNIWNDAYKLYSVPNTFNPPEGCLEAYNLLGVNTDYIKVYTQGNLSGPRANLVELSSNITALYGSINLLKSYTDLDLISSGTANSITVNGSKVVIGGQFRASPSWPEHAGTILYSPDGGITWSQPTDPGGKWSLDGDLSLTNAYAIAWTGSIWIATGNWLDKSISFSEDGQTWLAAINPIGVTSGTGKSIAQNSSELIIGGEWTILAIDAFTLPTQGNLTKASGTTLGITWGTQIRPTDIDTNFLTIYNMVYYKPTGNPVYLLLGNWRDSDGLGLGAISVSNNGISWSEPIIPNDPILTESTAFAAATNGTKWVVVGSFAEPRQKGANSITVSDNISGLTWGLPFGPDNTTGSGYGIIYSAPLFIALGNWDTGYITISLDAGVAWTRPEKLNGKIGETPGPPAVPILGILNGYATSISKTAIVNKYIITGDFSYSVNNVTTIYSLVTLEISSAGVITNVLPINITSTIYFTSRSVSWNGQSGNQARYVAVGHWDTGSIIYSTDLLVWNGPISPLDPFGTPISGTGSSVAWNGAQFAATGSWENGGLVTTSSDGINWTQPVSPPNTQTNNGYGIVWNDSTWLVTGWFKNALDVETGNIVPFSYGINFTVPSIPSLADPLNFGLLSSVGWNASKSEWVAIGQWYSVTGLDIGYISESIDGLNWSTARNIDGFDTSFGKFVSINNVLYLVGELVPTPSLLLSSENAENWSIVNINITSGELRDLAWSGSIWVAVGLFSILQWGNNRSGVVIISSDGISWSNPISIQIQNTPQLNQILRFSIASIGVSYNYRLNAVAWNGSYFIAVGNYGVTPGFFGGNYGIGEIFKSTDGIIWTLVEISSVTQLNNNVEGLGNIEYEDIGNDIAWNGSIWVAVGKWINIDGTTSTMTTSSDGINWTTPTSPSNSKSQLSEAKGIAWNGYIWVAIGNWRDINSNIYVISSSVDGIIWSDAIRPLFVIDSNYEVDSINWNGYEFTVSGTKGYSLSFTSPDGLNWTTNNTSSPFTSVSSKRILPYTLPQTFDPALEVNSYSYSAGNYQLTWLRDPVYGTGSQFVNNSQVQQPITHTFTATQRTQWLTFGSYYNSSQPVIMSLNKVSPENPEFVTDLVGPKFGWTNNLGHSIVDTTTLTIGGNLIETLSGQLMEVIDEFQTPLEKVSEKNRQLCRSDNGFNQTTYGYSNVNQTVTTHLPFWFSRGDPGCALPIDALNVDEVRVTVNFKPVTSLYYTDSRAITPIQNAEGGSLQPMQGSPFYYEDTSGSLMPHIEPNRLYNKALLPFPKLNMTSQLAIQDSYLLVEYIYLDKAEANRFRIADIQVPIVQHYIANPQDNRNTPYTRINLDIPNPTRDLFFYCQRYEAPSFNAHFLATRDLYRGTDPYGLWWPDASGLDARLYGNLRPAFSRSGSEPIRWLSLNYNESLTRYSTENVAVFRSLLPSIEQRKAPWLNRYYYNLPFGYQNGLNPLSMPMGEANMDKIKRITLSLGFHGPTGDPTDVYADRFFTRVFAETYNILRVYGGRATTMFAY